MSAASARSCTARPSAPTRCWSARAAHRRHHHARLPRRAGDAPARPAADLGPVGRFRADRRPRPAPRGRRAHARRRHDPDRGRCGCGAGRGRSAARSKAPRRSRSSSSMPTPMPTTSGRRSRPRAQVWPNEHVSASHEVLPEIREFERASTTALNAYLQPGRRRLSGPSWKALWRTSDFAGTFHIVQSNGGVMSTATARRLPVRTALSGPAAGVIAAAAIARAAGFDNVITCDLGGTSFDVSRRRQRQGRRWRRRPRSISAW